MHRAHSPAFRACNRRDREVPISALFRQGDEWAVFALRGGRASTTGIKIGLRNNRVAEVLSGLVEGDRVLLHPSDRVSNGVLVAERDSG